MTTKTKYRLLSVVGLLVTAIIIICIWQSGTSETLTDSQIKNLRKQYPICYNNQSILHTKQISLGDCVNLSDTFVYAKIKGEPQEYEVNINLGNVDLEKKRTDNGISTTHTFFEHTLSVIDDSEGILLSGEDITITANSFFKEYYPELEDGMEVVVPLKSRSEKPNNYDYTVDGMFYVTNDGYVLSAFEENTDVSQNYLYRTSGTKVDELLDNLKK